MLLYQTKEDGEVEELFSQPQVEEKIKEKSRGIRVFYFSDKTDGVQSDHHRHHNAQWQEELEGKSSVEAGTVIELLKASIPGANHQCHYFIVIQWDCGYVNAYPKQDLKDIGVFDLGPAG